MTRQVFKYWNRQALLQWIDSEHGKGNDYRDLEAALNLDSGLLDWWRSGLVMSITGQHLEAIAAYRRWSVEQVQEWLGLS